MHFLHFIKQLLHKRSAYQSLNTITIKKQAIIDNFYYFQNYKPLYQIVPVLKSNAYGHGLKQLCSIINFIPECRMVAIDSYPEYQIVANHTHKDILLMGETWGDNYALMNYHKTHLAVRNLPTIVTLGKTKKPWKLHLFINTGMNREGIPIDSLGSVLQTIKGYPSLQVVGVMSHLACADQPDHPLNQQQVTLFEQAVQLIRKADFSPTFIHLEATAGMINQIDTLGVCNTGRVGLGLYGYDPGYTKKNGISKFGEKLTPAMDIYSTVISIQSVKHDESVGYGANRVSDHDDSIATFPFGYKEGISRGISGKARNVQIHNHYYEILGNVNMNYSSSHKVSLFDDQVSTQKNLAIGSKVHIISSDLHDKNTLYAYYDLLGGIIYEGVSRDPYIKRIVI